MSAASQIEVAYVDELSRERHRSALGAQRNGCTFAIEPATTDGSHAMGTVWRNPPDRLGDEPLIRCNLHDNLNTLEFGNVLISADAPSQPAIVVSEMQAL